MNTAEVLMFLFPNSDPLRSWSVNGASMEIEEWHLEDKQPSKEDISDAYKTVGFAEWKQTRLNNSIDSNTGRAIRQALHPSCGADESDAINRDQIVAILNHLGIEPTDDFAKKNTIAIAETEKARIEKEALTNA